MATIHGDMEELYGDPVAIWRDWADDVRGARIVALLKELAHPLACG